MRSFPVQFLFSMMRWVLTSALVGSLIVSLGCTGARLEKRAKSLTGDLEPSSLELRKTVWMMPFANDSFLKNRELEAHLRQNMADYFTANFSSALFVDEKGDRSINVPLMPSGAVDTYNLALQGRRKGVGAIVMGAVTEIRGEKRMAGFWWFEEKSCFVVVDFMVTVVDTETGTKILDEYYSAEARIETVRYDQIKKGDLSMDLTEIGNAIKQLATEAGEGVITTLKSQPPKIFLSNVQGTTVKLTAGRNIGLFQNAELNVYGSAGVITGKDGQRFLASTAKTGTVRIVSLEGDEAVAEVIYGIVPNEMACLKPGSK